MKHPRFKSRVDEDNPDVIDRRGATPPEDAEPDSPIRSEALVYKSDARRAVHRAAAVTGVIAAVAAFLFGRSVGRAEAARSARRRR